MDHCVVCQRPADGFRPFWPRLKQCSACGHCMADLNICEVVPSKIYDRSYFLGSEYADYLRDRPVLERHFRDRLRDVMRFRRDGDLIEIGCAYGFFLGLARQAYRVRGYEIADEPAAYAREHLGVDARCEDFVDARVESESADIVVLWDAIEHLSRPDLTINKVAQVLRSGGFVFLTTGDIGSIVARIRREKWRLIHPPTHLHYFNRNTITRLLQNAGLRTLSISYVGVRRSLHQVLYSLLVLGKSRPSPLYRWVVNSPLAALSFELNTYDIMMVAGQKVPSPGQKIAESFKVARVHEPV